MSKISLSADCARCAALCCLALAFDRSSQFGLSKPAGEPCPNLDARGGCAIYASRAARGFGGCVAYDCLGAGQRVTQALFGGRSWRDDAGLIAAMTDAFAVVRRAHGLLLLLREAGRLPLSRDERRRLSKLATDIEAAGASVRAVAALSRDTTTFLRSLRPRLAAGQAGRYEGACTESSAPRPKSSP